MSFLRAKCINIKHFSGWNSPDVFLSSYSIIYVHCAIHHDGKLCPLQILKINCEKKPSLVFQHQTRQSLADWLKLRFVMHHLDLLHFTVTTTKWKKSKSVAVCFHVAVLQTSSTSQNRSPLITENLLIKPQWIKWGDTISYCLSSACFLSPRMCGQCSGDLNWVVERNNQVRKWEGQANERGEWIHCIQWEKHFFGWAAEIGIPLQQDSFKCKSHTSF